MAVGKQERTRRWNAVIGIMAEHGLDAVIVRGNCENPHSLYVADTQIRTPPSTIFALSRNGDARLFMMHPYDNSAPAPLYPDDDSVLAVREPDAALPAPSGLRPWLADRGVKALGVPGFNGMSPVLAEALKQALPNTKMVDVGPQMDALRRVKSEVELDYIRKSAATADKVWASVREFARAGRSITQLLSDIDHFLIEEGCDRPGAFYEGSFLMALPFEFPLCGWDDNKPLKLGDSFNLEVSPRYRGYFTQLTSPLSIGPVAPEVRRGYEAVLKARAACLPYVKVGAQSKTASDVMVASLADDGYEPCNPNIGHSMGFTLEELRIGAAPFTFKAGMSIVFHPIIKSPHFKMLMRGDTYFLTENGLERLTNYPTDIVEI